MGFAAKTLMKTSPHIFGSGTFPLATMYLAYRMCLLGLI